MKNSFVTDTVSLILRLERRRLSPKVKTIFEKAENHEVEIIVPAMVLAELCYLAEKKRIETNLEEFKKYSSKHKFNCCRTYY